MSLLSQLNKPITVPDPSKKYITNSRPLTSEEIELLKKALELMKKNTEISWSKLRTYVSSFIFAAVTFLVFKSFWAAAAAFLGFFTFFRLVPFLIKGDSALLKKDLAGGIANIKTGPVIIVEDDYGNTYTKRIYLDDVIVDGIYTRNDTLKYSDLTDRQNVEVTYSPNAQYIFQVKSL